ncbi:hypothetical protein Hanom_Chr07g00616371 [Helianthus anomalus]
MVFHRFFLWGERKRGIDEYVEEWKDFVSFQIGKINFLSSLYFLSSLFFPLINSGT